MLGRDNSRYKGFDGLRGISIILVIISHLGFWGNFPQEFSDRAIPVFAGIAGVNLFFVTSGFLITAILLKEKSVFGNISVRMFVIRRALRLMPAFLIYICVVGLLMSVGVLASSGVALLMSAIYLYNFVPFGAHYTSELAHTWSLAIEEHYYLAWPWFVAKLKIKFLIKVIVALLFVCFVAMIVATGSRYRWTIPGIAPILVGCLCAIYHFVLLPKRPNYWSPSDKVIGLTAVLLWSLPLFIPPLFFKLVWLPQIGGFGLMVYWVFRNGESLIVKLLEMKTLIYIGTISYGLYLWQGLFVTNGPGGKLWIQHFPQNVVLTLLAAMLSYHFFEVHFLRMKGNFARNKIVAREPVGHIPNA